MNPVMYGWTGGVLHIDLAGRNSAVENPSPGTYKRCIGGKGLAGEYLSEHIALPWDSPSMPLLFFSGPLVNTPSPTSGRMTVMSRSPLTGTVGDTSVGGALGTQIKRAGYDGIVVTGVADTWCGLEIDDDCVRIVDCPGLHGMDTATVYKTTASRGSVAAIGPAAENGVSFSGIVVDGHYCSGRGGLGLVMAAKRLKYIRVYGAGKTAVHSPEELKQAREQIFRLASASPAIMGPLGIGEFGTGALYDLTHSRDMMPTDNFRSTSFEEAPMMNACRYKKLYGMKKTGCSGCHILCKKLDSNGAPIPEFETMSHFSALIGNSSTDTVLQANNICNAMGMDTISAASTIACHGEIEGRKFSPAEVLDLLRDIALSRGVGAELKHGSHRYAASRGREELSMSVKKLELPAYDPRGAYGMALAYATSTRGGCHLRAYPISHEILRKPVATDRFTFSGKARAIKIAEDMNAVIDSLTACKFLFFSATLEEFSRAFYGVTGVETTAQDLLRAGERIYYRERAMNASNGFRSADDDLPPRFFEEPGNGGDGIPVKPLDRKEFLKARADYYRVRGLDDDGMPRREKSEELGIPWKSCS